MTTSRLVLTALLAGAVSGAWAQTQPAPAPASQNLTWAVSEFGGGSWGSRLPQLLIRGWNQLPPHTLTEGEKAALSTKATNDAVAALLKQSSQLRLDLDKKKIVGPLPAGEPDTTLKTIAGLDLKIAQVRAGMGVPAVPDTMGLQPVWAPGRDSLPWPQADAATLAAQSKALYAVTGSVRVIGGYLDVAVSVYSAIEGRTLVSWQARFAPEEAPSSMAEAADALRATLLGRPWAGLKLTSNVGGTRVRVGESWHDLPWSSDDLSPGAVDLLVEPPGRPSVTQQVVLEAGQRVSLPLELATDSNRIVLETEPAGASLYVDSRYIGPSPQTIDRPLAVTRVRAQAPGFETGAWEIGPQTSSNSKFFLKPPTVALSVPEAKDRFYWSLAAFSFSLTSTVFLGAWSQEQAELTSQYALATPINVSNYNKAYDRYWAVTYTYAGSVVLTSAVFVWMMFELGAYLTADQATLP